MSTMIVLVGSLSSVDGKAPTMTMGPGATEQDVPAEAEAASTAPTSLALNPRKEPAMDPHQAMKRGDDCRVNKVDHLCAVDYYIRAYELSDADERISDFGREVARYVASSCELAYEPGMPSAVELLEPCVAVVDDHIQRMKAAKLDAAPDLKRILRRLESDLKSERKARLPPPPPPSPPENAHDSDHESTLDEPEDDGPIPLRYALEMTKVMAGAVGLAIGTSYVINGTAWEVCPGHGANLNDTCVFLLGVGSITDLPEGNGISASRAKAIRSWTFGSLLIGAGIALIVTSAPKAKRLRKDPRLFEGRRNGRHLKPRHVAFRYARPVIDGFSIILPSMRG